MTDSRLTRRTFVAWAVGTVPLVLVARRADALAAGWLASDDETMRALATTILPSELGVDGAAQAARDFQRWIDGYREHAEMVHGYGTSALALTRPSPRARWAAQLESLRRDGFSAKPLPERRAAIERSLAGGALDRMPDVADAQHVAVGLLAFWYGGPDANDLCYRARIGRETCRPLAAQGRKPLPLAGHGRSGAGQR